MKNIHLGRLGQYINRANPAELHHLSMAFDLIAPAESITPSHGGDRLGPWNIQTQPDGVVDWTIRADTSLRERHSWYLQSLSSRRMPGTFRVVLLGSSAAASFGYWGEFTLASILQRKLTSVCHQRSIEVIDLACVNATLPQITEILKRSLTLSPDLAVVYCGNNEGKTLEARLAGGARDCPSDFAARWACEQPDVTSYARLLNTSLDDHTASMARKMVGTARHHGLQLVFVIPEYNLADWRPRERMPFCLSEEDCLRWMVLVRQAEDELANGQAAAALTHLDSALQIDKRMSRRTQWLRGQALQATGQTELARESFVQARDTGIGAIADGIPQITKGMIDTLRRTLNELAVPYVDLPTLLAEDAGAAIPNRRHFLDYCHLNSRGHDLLATALARQVLRAVPTLGTEPNDMEGCTPARREESLAALVAAIHNFHHGQPLAVTRYWLERSLCHATVSRPLLEFFSDNVCGAWRERFTIAWFRQSGLYDLVGEKYFFFFCKFFYHARFDHDLKHLIDSVLNRSPEDASSSFQRQTAALVQDMNGDLHSLFFLDRRQGFTTSDRHAARVGWERRALEIYVTEPSSTCEFPLDNAEQDMVLQMQVSPMAQDRHLACAIQVNQYSLATVKIDEKRQQITASVPRSCLKPGLNTLTFTWNSCLTLMDQPEAHNRHRHIQRYGYYPVFARVHALRIGSEDAMESLDGGTGC